jgi:putative phage-type endonuclease
VKIENRKFHNVIQGSAEWHALRSNHFTASEAAAMMGVSKYQTRDELLKAKATGLSQEVSPAQQALFDRGHAAEASARPIAEGIIDDELLPATVTAIVDGLPLLASCDGVTMLNDKVWEHKLYNAELDRIIQDGEPLPEHYTVQMEQQLMLTGADVCLFMISDGTEEMMERVWYTANPALRQRIVAGWTQFAEDLAGYQHRETAAASTGAAPETLPALRIEVTGMVTASNLAEFKETALQVFGGINTDLNTDQDFANAESTVKWCKQVEERLQAAKDHALSQTSSIDELFRTIDAISEQARAKRLELDKLVKARKESIRVEILNEAKTAYMEHAGKLNTRLRGQYITSQAPDFAGAMKSKRTIDSLRGACNDLLAQSKIEANELADKIEINLRTIEQAGQPHLFHDKTSLALKAPDDLAAIIAQRVAEHERMEKEKEERIKAKAEEDARRKIEAEQRAELAKKNEESIPDANAAARALGVISDTVYCGTGVLVDDDLINRLRDRAGVCESRRDADLMIEAADEIERLRA